MTRRIDVNLEELDHVLDEARQAPLSDADYDKLKNAVHALAAMVVRPRNSEKTNAVLRYRKTPKRLQPNTKESGTPPPGHGRNGADAFHNARKVNIAHPHLEARRPLPGLWQRQCIRAEGAEGAGADCWAAALGSQRLFSRTAALRCLRANLHGTRAGGSGTGEVRRNSDCDDRAAQVWKRRSLPSTGTTGSPTRDSIAGSNAVGDGRRRRGAVETGAR